MKNGKNQNPCVKYLILGEFFVYRAQESISFIVLAVWVLFYVSFIYLVYSNIQYSICKINANFRSKLVSLLNLGFFIIHILA